jgi:cell wall-associated NlpC family hydrolase
LVFYDTGHPDSRHVVLLLADGLMLHVAACGDVANVNTFWGHENGTGYDYLGVRRVDVDSARLGALDDIARQDNQGFGPDAPWLGDGVSAPLDLVAQGVLQPFDR